MPVLISSSAMRLAWSTGMAKPRPIEPLCVLGLPAEGGDRRVHADQLTVHVDQRPARVARVDRRVGLDGVEHGVLVPASPAAAPAGSGALTMPVGDRALETQRGTDGHHVLAHPQAGRRAQRDRRQVRTRSAPHHRDVTGRVGPDHRERVVAVGEGDRRGGLAVGRGRPDWAASPGLGAFGAPRPLAAATRGCWSGSARRRTG